MRIRGYFSKPKGVREQNSLVNTALQRSSAVLTAERLCSADGHVSSRLVALCYHMVRQIHDLSVNPVAKISGHHKDRGSSSLRNVRVCLLNHTVSDRNALAVGTSAVSFYLFNNVACQ